MTNPTRSRWPPHNCLVEIQADWTAAQAWAVLDILEALHRHIWDRYERPLCDLLSVPSEPMEDGDLDEQHGPINGRKCQTSARPPAQPVVSLDPP